MTVPVFLFGETPRNAPSFVARLLAAADAHVAESRVDFELPRFPWIRRSPSDERSCDPPRADVAE